MRLLGFNFDKLNIEKFSSNFKDLKVNTNIDISNIEEHSVDFLKSKEIFLKISFKYNLNYDPKIAIIEFSGYILIGLDEKQGKNLLKEWKSKKLSDDYKISFFNIIKRKTDIKALQLEEELNLPLHVKFPVFKKKDN